MAKVTSALETMSFIEGIAFVVFIIFTLGFIAWVARLAIKK